MLFNEPKLLKFGVHPPGERVDMRGFSALQRAEIAEINRAASAEPEEVEASFSALQRAEIAEIDRHDRAGVSRVAFQCSSTSRNC